MINILLLSVWILYKDPSQLAEKNKVSIRAGYIYSPRNPRFKVDSYLADA